MPDVDVLIIGQGLAGSCLAWTLHWSGRRVLIVDRGEHVTASRIAAGLITPMTGRRMAPTLRFEDCYQHASEFFRRIESEQNCRLLEEQPAIRRFVDEDEKQIFEQKFRSSNDRFSLIKAESGEIVGVEMRQAARLNVARFLDLTRQHFISLEQYQQQDLNPDTDIVVDDDGVTVASLGVRSARIVFCQGYQPVNNPWFPTTPDGPAKGEILRVRLPDYAEERVVHQGIWVVPDSQDAGLASFLVGATYDRVNLNGEPTTNGRDELLRGLKQITAVQPEVIHHFAAVRAGTKRRRPIVGKHAENDRVLILNGLGSRGALLAPLAAQVLTDLIAGNPISNDFHDVIELQPKQSRDQHSRGESIRPKSLTQLAHSVIRRILQPGDTAIDATAGNGHDTQMLATLVGPFGRVIAIDIQQSAIDSTSDRLAKAGLAADLRLGDHADELLELQTSGLRVKAVMLNLGYLPGSDKQITTGSTSTRAAIHTASQMLMSGGAVTIIAYRSHAGGLEEAAMVDQWIAELPTDFFEMSRIEGDPTNATSPVLFVVRRIAI
ncbi:MAG: FAD-dependent oxidoreductase [Planctomycetota bacterium]|nr:FAD-dependent oxidoreductase [Planctomycetota bacterium]